MAKYRKNPVTIEATQWFEYGDHKEVKPFYGKTDENDILHKLKVCDNCGDISSNHGQVETTEGNMTVCPGDWIATGHSKKLKTHYWVIKPDYFIENYEEV